jgi:hypothetical protein
MGEIKNILIKTDTDLLIGDTSPFSPKAFENLKGKINDYVIELIYESVKIAGRYNADIVSSAHVEQASNNLVSSITRKIYRHIGTVGGIFLGASISNFITLTSSPQLSILSVLVSGGLGIVGSFMVALHIAKE